MQQAQPNSESAKSRIVLLLMPFCVLLFTRAGIEICARLLPARFSWIPSALIYFISIEFCLWYARRRFGIRIAYGHFNWRLSLKARYLFAGIIVPALIPLWFFIKNVSAVPPVFLIYIVLFAAVNPFFEESFWRGLLSNLPYKSGIKTLYSSLLFCSTHYFLWGSYWLVPSPKWIAAVISTFIMGILWMWYYQKTRNLILPILSHSLVDVLNLSVAVFYGVKLVTV
jgi:CAAX protease family protein